MNRIEQVRRDPLPESDFRTILGDCKIITYPQLASYSSLDELLPKPNDFCMIFVLDAPIGGHWCCQMV